MAAHSHSGRLFLGRRLLNALGGFGFRFSRLTETEEVLLFAGIGLLYALLPAIPKAFIIWIRYQNPKDPIYKLGTVPFADDNEKYTEIQMWANTAVGVLTLFIAGSTLLNHS